MPDFDEQIDIDGLSAVADKLDAWADMAELMGDDRGAGQLREHAQIARIRAMHLLDDH